MSVSLIGVLSNIEHLQNQREVLERKLQIIDKELSLLAGKMQYKILGRIDHYQYEVTQRYMALEVIRAGQLAIVLQ